MLEELMLKKKKSHFLHQLFIHLLFATPLFFSVNKRSSFYAPLI